MNNAGLFFFILFFFHIWGLLCFITRACIIFQEEKMRSDLRGRSSVRHPGAGKLLSSSSQLLPSRCHGASVTSASDPLTGERTCYGPFNSWGLFVITHMKSPWIGVRSLLLLSAGLRSYQALVTAGATGPAHVQLNALKPLYLLALAFFFFFFFFFFIFY